MSNVSTNYEAPGREVVYAHKMQKETTFFYIGSGSEQRARNLNGRTPSWQAYVSSHGGIAQIEKPISILERHHCPARSRLREMEQIYLHQPETNDHHGRGKPFPDGIMDGRPKGSKERCACGAPDCYGAEVEAEVAARRASLLTRQRMMAEKSRGLNPRIKK